MIFIFKEILLFEKSYSKSKFEIRIWTKSNASSYTYIIISASNNFFLFKEIINIIALILMLKSLIMNYIILCLFKITHKQFTSTLVMLLFIDFFFNKIVSINDYHLLSHKI